MNDESPPKRVTRARAAAKSTTDTGVKTTKIATAASKAKVTRNTTTAKRKNKADDTQEEENEEPAEQIIEPEVPKTTRGRPRKAAVQPEPETEEDAAPPAKATRGRPKKVVTETDVLAPTRSLRGRGKVVEVVPEEEAIVVEDPPKKPTRARAGAGAGAGAISKATAPKKSVKFEEPDKENIVPPPANAKGKAKTAETGLKAKPVRKTATTSTRATRGRAKLEEKEQKTSPLSPKKATQVTIVKDQSEDELATNEKTPMKPLMKSPMKAPGSIFGSAKRLDFSNSITVNRAITQDLGGSVLGSPARRPPQSPFKESIKNSPQRPAPGDSMLRSPFKFSLPAQRSTGPGSPFKSSLLQSPARRPQSPIKLAESGSPSKSGSTFTFGTTPRASTFKVATPRTLTKSAVRSGQILPNAIDAAAGSPQAKNDSMAIDEPSLKFSGRLSSIMPREIDPTISPAEAIVEEIEDQIVTKDDAGETMIVDTIVVEDSKDSSATTLLTSPPKTNTGSFALRDVDENPFQDSDSEDELASASPMYSPVPLSSFKTLGHNLASPTAFAGVAKTPRTGAGPKSLFSPGQQIGFTPLARQLSDWMAPSPAKPGQESEETASNELHNTDLGPAVQPSPAKSTYFDEEMSIREEMQAGPEISEAIIEDIHFEPVELDEEDLSLAHEADEMSLLDPEAIEEIQNATQTLDEEQAEVENVQLAFEDIIYDQPQPAETADSNKEANEWLSEPALSEASQEYGDENAMPIDPAIIAASTPQVPATTEFSTPKRVLTERIFHTVSKVPLKAAAEDFPMRPSPMKRSASISRLPVQRPSSNLSRSNTVISYSPSKRTTRAKSPSPDVEMQDACATPSKSDVEMWSSIGTPARTPRRDLDTTLLKGAVVFVDVHTTEGADASALFTELLTQMGARCVKRWDWNENSPGGKIGITHVVFKDGGKRTLEKARETDGVVNCVGVGWVLDCERENKWLPESPYSVDTSLVPRGGHRRRKSMEPRALANMNGTLFPSATPTRPARKTMSPSKEFSIHAETPFTSKSHRRDSVQWVRSPSTSSTEDKVDDQTLILSPIPATPAPEALSAYGEEGLYGDDTPGNQTPYFLHKEQLVQKTAPPGKRYFDGENGNGGFLSEKKDESVMMRLMAARRKSLQFAPKIGSPLARGEAW